MKLLIIPLLLLAITPNICYGGGRILLLTPMGSQSHKIYFMGFTEVLAKRGHHITIVSGYESSKPMTNVREVVIQNISSESLLADIFEKPTLSPIFDKAPQICVDGLGQPQIQALKNEKFDLIIVSMFFDYCYLSLVHHFKVPFIYASASGMYSFLSDMINNVDFPSFTAGKLLGYGVPLSFTQRLTASGLNTAMWFGGHHYLVPRIMNLCTEKGLCPPDMPSFDEINKNASLAIFNSVRSLEVPPRPAMPNVIYAGGAHIKESNKPLPKDLEEWVQGSGEEGFIFFSLGSVINPSYLPERYRKILVNVFGSLKQRVLWKWSEDTMPDLPPNVKLGKWLPQTDILGHPKLRLFITHGGLLSTMESTYYGVPIVGMPVFADQHTNMAEVEKDGWGKTMQWNLLQEDAFRNIILEVLNTKKMKEISQHRAELMKDRLLHPADEAAYWVEYVMKHKGAPHIMSPTREMRWYEIYNMDVWAFMVAAFSAIIYLFYMLLKFAFKKCLGKSAKKIKVKRN